ncbi:hypothetical protein ACKFKG_29525 [Phormidesmis sp. 146-35]
MTDSEKESEKQKGLSKEAWTAISAIAVAFIGAMAIFPTIWKDSAPQNTSPSGSPSGSIASPSSPSVSPSEKSVTSPRPSLAPSSTPTVVPTAPAAAQTLAQDLEAANIDFSDSKELAQLNNPFSKYPQFATSCLNLLKNKRLKKRAYFDVIFWNYTEELGGQINADSPNGDIDTNILKAAMISAYNTRNGSSALSFGDIVELNQ